MLPSPTRGQRNETMRRLRSGHMGPRDEDPEAIALRIHQIAAVAGVPEAPLAHVLYLTEECLLDVEQKVEALRLHC